MEQTISDEAVFDATGRDWSSWFRWLDDRGASGLPHRDIARLLQGEHDLSGWWCQSITVRYEQARGRRVPGQTSGGDFQVSTQKTLAADPDQVWRALLATGIVDSVQRWQEGAVCQGGDGTVTVRRVIPPERLRFWYVLADGTKTTVEVTLTPSSREKATLRFTHSGLPDNAARESFRAHWRRLTARVQKGLAAAD